MHGKSQHIRTMQTLNNVDVSTREDPVTLSRSVNNLPHKERVIETAKSVRGLIEAIDRLTVNAVARLDHEIRTCIKSLYQVPATGAVQTIVAVQNAVDTLTGSFRPYAEQHFTIPMASGLKVVKSVHDQISIDYLGNRADKVAVTDAKACQHLDVWVMAPWMTRPMPKKSSTAPSRRRWNTISERARQR